VSAGRHDVGAVEAGRERTDRKDQPHLPPRRTEQERERSRREQPERRSRADHGEHAFARRLGHDTGHGVGERRPRPAGAASREHDADHERRRRRRRGDDEHAGATGESGQDRREAGSGLAGQDAGQQEGAQVRGVGQAGDEAERLARQAELGPQRREKQAVAVSCEPIGDRDDPETGQREALRFAVDRPQRRCRCACHYA
jgi:hypothetical protein